MALRQFSSVEDDPLLWRSAGIAVHTNRVCRRIHPETMNARDPEIPVAQPALDLFQGFARRHGMRICSALQTSKIGFA
jgi:hypothetical protein